MKTVILTIIVIAIILYSFRGIIKHFKGEDDCCNCSGGKEGECHCKHKKN